MNLPTDQRNEAYELELIAKAFRAISGETSYEGAARALLREAINYCRATRGAVLLSEGEELLAKAGAIFPSGRTGHFISQPPLSEFRMPEELNVRVLTRREIVVRETAADNTALVEPIARAAKRITQLFLPLAHQGCTIGVLYLESDQNAQSFVDKRVSVLSMLASHATVLFEFARLFEAFRETNLWAIKGQEIGRMGSYRWNTRTRVFRTSRECRRIFDLDLDANSVPYDTFRSRIHSNDLLDLERALTDAVSTRSPFDYEYRVVHRDGVTLNVHAVGQCDYGPDGDVELEGIITDVSDRMASERALVEARNELVKASRLPAVGELAGSIAHEISQPLTIIVMCAEVCLRSLVYRPAKLDDVRKYAALVIEQAYRVSNVINGGKRAPIAENDMRTAPSINEVSFEGLSATKNRHSI
jgi:GAF domain-containing protein